MCAKSLWASFLPLHFLSTNHPVSSVFCVATLHAATCAQWSLQQCPSSSPRHCCIRQPLAHHLATQPLPEPKVRFPRCCCWQGFILSPHSFIASPHSSYHQSGCQIFPLPTPRLMLSMCIYPLRLPLLPFSSSILTTYYDCCCCQYYKLELHL